MASADDKKKDGNNKPVDARPLHWVFKIGDRGRAVDFFRKDLGMRVLRHEEFAEGCKATCNGPYDGKWSKTMIGYGPEDDHFVLELTYNYGVGAYKLGDDFREISVAGKGEDGKQLTAPDGYKFVLKGDKKEEKERKVEQVDLACKELKATLAFWRDLLGFAVAEDKADAKGAVLVKFPKGPDFALRFKEIGKAVDHGTAFGRVAFAVPSEHLANIEQKVKAAGHKVLTPYTKLDTPGKASVQVVILADPDGHEICFVGDEGFRQLSKVDPKAGEALDEAMAADKSNEWFAKKGKAKKEA
jgi:catechol 2,3-dioxygenase-like lactoylglutathione lyase family enzyme